MRTSKLAAEFLIGTTLLAGTAALAQNAQPRIFSFNSQNPFAGGIQTIHLRMSDCTTNDYMLNNVIEIDVSITDLVIKSISSNKEVIDVVAETFSKKNTQPIFDAWSAAVASPEAAVLVDPKTPAEVFAANDGLYNDIWKDMTTATKEFFDATGVHVRLKFDTVSVDGGGVGCHLRKHGLTIGVNP